MGRHLRAAFRRVALVVSSILLSLLIVEGLVRAVVPQPLSAPWMDVIDGSIVLRPNAHGRYAVPNAFDVNFSVDSQRFRRPGDVQPVPEPGVVRIVALGDSFTFGVGAKDDETYPAQLERILRKRLVQSTSKRDSDIEVINAGIPGAGIEHEALYFETWVKRFRPEIMIWGIFFNDAERTSGLFFLDESGRAQIRPLRERMAAIQTLRSIQLVVERIPGYVFLAQHSHLLALFRNALLNVVQRLHEAALAKSETGSQTRNAAERFRERTLPLMVAEVKWLHKHAQAAGSRLAVVFLPSRELIYPSQASPFGNAEVVRWKSDAIVEALRKVCSEGNIPFADITSLIRTQAEKSPQPLYYLRGDAHPTPEGYRAVAVAVATFLVADGVISP